MARKIQTILLLSFCLNIAIAQDNYYWANGQKYALELSNEDQYVLFKGNNRELVAQNLRISPQEILTLERLTFTKTIVNRRLNTFIDEANLYWGFVSRKLDKENINSSEIIYAAPSYRFNGNLVRLSNFFYVKLKQEQDVKILEKLADENGVTIIGNNSFMPLWFILSCDKNSKGTALEMANLFYESGNFSNSEPDLMVDYGANCRNDTFFNQQWHLNNTGQFGGTAGNDTRACQAWDITMGCGNIVVAVLDHGLEFNHPDFNNISPISFDTDTGTSPSIVRGDHGVPVAGIIGASANNGLGVAGISPNVQLMSISNSLILQPLVSQRLADGINFAWQNGADVINNSWGSNSLPQQGLINDAINNATTQGRGGLGTIVIFSSGNDNNNGISFPSNNAQVISVGALSMCNQRKSPSSCDTENWGSNFGTGLDVMAPGVLISTTDRQGNIGFNPNVPLHLQAGGTLVATDYADQNYTTWFNGTSAAAPQVAGIAALVLSLNPNLTLQQVRNIIQSTTDKIGGVTYTLNAGEQAGLTWNNQLGYGRVNALRAVQASLPTITGGTNTLCTTSNSTYSLSFIPGNSTVNWSVSPASYFATNGGASTTGMGGTATIRAASNFAGSATISFVIQSNCVTSTITRTIWVGAPQISNQRVDGNSYYGPTYICPGNHWLQVTPLGTTNNANWTVQNGVPFHVTPNYLDFTMYSNVSSIAITANATNVCGTGANAAFYLMRKTWGCPSYYSIAAYPNPASQELTVSTVSTLDLSNASMLFEDVLNDTPPTPSRAVLIDEQGRSVCEGQLVGNDLKLNLKGLKRGLYYIYIYVDDQIYKEQILVE